MARPKSGYKSAEGFQVPGVTTITGRFADKGALMQWAFKQGKEGKAKLYEERDKAGEIGTAVHDMAELHLRKKRVTVPSGLRKGGKEKAALAFQAFKDEWETCGYTVIALEKVMVHSELHYGGCPDVVVRDPKGRIWVVDFKTGSGIYFDMVLQLSAYCQLVEDQMELSVDGGAHIIRPNKNSGQLMMAKWSPDYLEDACELFNTYRMCYENDRTLKKLM